MPAQTNLTIKKNDGTTDILWTAIAPSGGDKSPAIWKSLSVGTSPGFQPTLSLTARSNAERTARRLEGKVTYPYTVTGTDGKVSIVDTMILQFSAVVPQRIDQTTINEFAAQAARLLAHSNLIACVQQGYSAT